MRFDELCAGIVWGLTLANERSNAYTKFIRKLKDTEYVYNYVMSHRNFLDNNPAFNGFSIAEIIISAQREAKNFDNYFIGLYNNCLCGKVPDFEKKFVLLDKHQRFTDSKMRRKMYGKRKESDQPPSVIRLYALKLPSKVPGGIPGYITIGGGIKLSQSTYDMKELQALMKILDSTQTYLEKHNIKTKEELIAHIEKSK